MDLGFEEPEESRTSGIVQPVVLTRRPRVLRANADEAAAHERLLDALDKSAGDGGSLWRKDESAA
ncbi:MAG: DNA polymerase III subunit epsilon, partial [Rhodanobacter sp.]